MRTRWVSIFAAAVVLIGMLCANWAFGQRTAGVDAGDWAEYSFLHFGNETFPQQLPLDWESMRLTVQGVSGTNITFEQIVRFNNGTEEDGTNSVDVDTGQGHGTGLFIAENLNESDLIYTSPSIPGPFGLDFGGITINETIGRLYIGEDAKVNHLNLTASQAFPEGSWTGSANFYWYKATGIVAEMSVDRTYQWNNGNTTWWEWKMVIRTIIPEYPSLIILPLLMITTPLMVAICRRMQ